MFDTNPLISLSSRNASVDEDYILSLAEMQKAPARSWETQDPEGQLAVDVFETDTELYVVATMAGSKPQDIELHLHDDVLTIRGKRTFPIAGPVQFFYEECFWGAFSRTIVLPVDVQADLVHSEYRNGVLLVRLPKAKPKGSIPILVVEE